MNKKKKRKTWIRDLESLLRFGLFNVFNKSPSWESLGSNVSCEKLLENMEMMKHKKIKLQKMRIRDQEFLFLLVLPKSTSKQKRQWLKGLFGKKKEGDYENEGNVNSRFEIRFSYFPFSKQYVQAGKINAKMFHWGRKPMEETDENLKR